MTCCLVCSSTFYLAMSVHSGVAPERWSWVESTPDQSRPLLANASRIQHFCDVAKVLNPRGVPRREGATKAFRLTMLSITYSTNLAFMRDAGQGAGHRHQLVGNQSLHASPVMLKAGRPHSLAPAHKVGLILISNWPSKRFQYCLFKVRRDAFTLAIHKAWYQTPGQSAQNGHALPLRGPTQPKPSRSKKI